MSTEAEAQRRRENQAPFWNEKQARAATDKARALVWYDACRMLATQADKTNKPPLWGALAQHLHNFFQHYAG